MLRFIDIFLVVLGTVVSLALGVPLIGYAVGVLAWILLRGLGIVVEQRARGVEDVAQQLSLRLTHRFLRMALLVGAALVARGAGGNQAALVALLVITGGFTAQLSSAALRRRALVNSPNRRSSVERLP
jgi:phosphate/sulfate permease